MLKIFLLILFNSLLTISFGQTSSLDSTKRSIPESDFNDRVYVKVQEMPRLRNGTSAFADTLKNELLKNNSKFKKGKMCFSFVVERTGKIDDVKKIKGIQDEYFPLENQIIQIISSSSGLWVLGRHKGNMVNCYSSICITFTKHDLTVTE